MRTITLTKAQFDDHVFPALVSGSAASESEMETAIRALRKFKDPKITRDEVVDAQLLEKAEKAGQRVFPLRKLKVDEHAFQLEEDEHRLLVERMKAHIGSVHLLAAEEYMETYHQVRDAEETTD